MAELPRKELRRAVVSLLVTIVAMAMLLFGAAGTLSWGRGWTFLAVFVALILVSMAWLWRVNPEILVARARPMREGTKAWDRALMPVLLLAFALILPVAGLDAGRFPAAAAGAVWVLIGYLLMATGFAGVAWAEAVNRHFEPSVRIQSERGHRVVTSGPYAYVRHPGYVSASLMTVGIALALGSFWAVLPALAVIALLLIRTHLEDEMLKHELPGYVEFARSTPYKWIPGIW